MPLQWFFNRRILFRIMSYAPLSGPLISLLFRLSLPFLSLSLWRLQVSYLVLCPSIWVCQMLHNLTCVEIQVIHLGQENQRSDSLFLLHCIRWYMISIYSLTKDVCFDPLIKVVFASFPHFSIFINVNK